MTTRIKEAQELVARGAWRDAITLLEGEIAVHPREAELFNVLATAFIKGGELDRADAALAAAIQLDPRSYKPWANRAIVWKSKGDLARSAESLREAIAREATLPRLFARLGQTELERGELELAREALASAYAMDPSATHRGLLAQCLSALARHGELLELLDGASGIEAALQRAPALFKSERFAELSATLTELVAARPKPEALSGLIALTTHPGFARFALELSSEELMAGADKAACVEVARALAGVVRAYIGLDLLDLAEPVVDRALALAPDDATALGAALDLYLITRRHSEAILMGERVLERSGAVLFAMLHHEGLSPEDVADAHRALALRSLTPFETTRRTAPDLTADRRLHVGFLSPDFRNHAVFRFAEGLIRELPRSRFRISAYFTLPHMADARTRRFIESDVTFVPIDPSTSDDEAAARIAADGVDVLIDLAGWSFGQRLGIFARRPAPVALTYLGWPATTGLGPIDGRVSDALADPPGHTERLHSETLLRLPGTGWNFCDRHEVAIKPRPRGRLALASFQRASKISEANLAAWARILHELPDAVLLLKGRGLGSEAARKSLRAAMSAASVDMDRVRTRSWTQSVDDHLGLWNDVDIALDTFPYAGTTTTCETIWMGVPVVTLAGSSHVSRVGASLLASVGLDDLVARDWDEYVEKTVELARDDARLEELRGALRERMRSSLLADSAAFAGHFGALIEQAWRTFQASGEAAIDATSRRVGETGTAVFVAPSLAERDTFVAVERHYDPLPEQNIVSRWIGSRALHLRPTAAGVRPLLDLVAARPAGAPGVTVEEPHVADDPVFARFAASARRRGIALSPRRSPPAEAILALSTTDATALAVSGALPSSLLVIGDAGDPAPLARRLRGLGRRLFRAAPGVDALVELAADAVPDAAERVFVALDPSAQPAEARASIVTNDDLPRDLAVDEADACALFALALAAVQPPRRAALLEAALRTVPEVPSLAQALVRARLGYELGRPALIVDALTPYAATPLESVPSGAWLPPTPSTAAGTLTARALYAELLLALTLASPSAVEAPLTIARYATDFVRAGGKSLAMSARFGVTQAHFVHARGQSVAGAQEA